MEEDQKSFKMEIHPEAARKLNDQAEALLREMTTRPISVHPAPAFAPDIPVKAIFLKEDIIGAIETSTVSAGGSRMARFIEEKGKAVGFEGDYYKNFARLCETIQKGNPFRHYVSLNTLENLVFRWSWERYSGATNLSMTDHVIPKCEAAIQEYEVWIPISHLYIQTDMQMGRVTLKTFSTAMFQGLRDSYQSLNIPQKSKTNFNCMIGDMQGRLNGLAAATMFVTAEPSRAYEVALEETEKAVAILRIFSRAAAVPEVSSYCAPYGQKTPKSVLYYLFHEGKVAASHDGGVDTDDTMWTVSANHVQLWAESGMGNFIRLFFEPRPSPFERNVVNSLMVYSRSMLAGTLSEKLVFVFSSLESLLLRDQNENIQQNVAERIAFVVGKDVKERREIIKNYKDTYSLRSSFVHHGRSVEETENLVTFFRNVFQFFFRLVLVQVTKYKTRDEFLRALEDMKLT